jgi:hypothetical protein
LVDASLPLNPEEHRFCLRTTAGLGYKRGVALRSVIKVSVAPSSKKIIHDMAERHGMREIWVASTIYEWFAAQDDVVRKSILGLLPEGYEVDVAEIALERIIAGRKKRGGG